MTTQPITCTVINQTRVQSQHTEATKQCYVFMPIINHGHITLWRAINLILPPHSTSMRLGQQNPPI